MPVTNTAEIAARLERLPASAWLVRVRLIIGTATFFDAFDALALSYVLPVLAREWNLTPDQIGLAISIGFLGQLFGALLAGWYAERRGRLRTAILTVAVYSAFSLLLAFSPNLQVLLVLRFIQGIGLGGEVPIAASYISEIARAEGRGRLVLFYELVFPLGLMVAALAGYFIVPLGWQWLFIIGGLGGFIVLAMRSQLPESPRWLAGVGRHTEAESAMAHIEKNVQESIRSALPEPKQIYRVAANQHTSWRELLSAAYRRRTVVAWVMWFSIYLASYGVVTWLPSIYSSVFKLPLQTALGFSLATQAAGFVGTVICALVIDRIGRRPIIAGAMIVGGIFLLLVWALGTTAATQLLVLASVSYVFIAAASIAMYAYTPELYPTRMRALGTSAGTAWLRLASFAGPFLIGTILVVPSNLPLIFLLFGSIVIVGGIIAALWAIETRQRVLEEISR